MHHLPVIFALFANRQAGLLREPFPLRAPG